MGANPTGASAPPLGPDTSCAHIIVAAFAAELRFVARQPYRALAAARSHRNTTAIFVFNLLMFTGIMFTAVSAGFLFQFAFYGAEVGTVITMVWSFITDRDR